MVGGKAEFNETKAGKAGQERQVPKRGKVK
jgi:hypothetical protein